MGLTNNRASGRGNGLIIAPQMDVHAFAVRHSAEQKGHSILIVDSSLFCSDFDLVSRWHNDSASGELISRSGDRISLEALSGLWWRRPTTPTALGQVRSDFQAIAIQERKEALFGSLNALVQSVFNNPGRSRAANQKLVQLSAAQKAGLSIPHTLITNDPNEAKEFYRNHPSGVIYKIFRAPDEGFYPTRLLNSEDLHRLDAIKYCPCIIQEYIDGLFDLRVTIVGNHIFAARIDYEVTEDHIDSRVTAKSCKAFELPPEISGSLLSLVDYLGLFYCAIDMRYSAELGYVFFEANPEGQYLWTEIEAGLPISTAIADHLTSASGG